MQHTKRTKSCCNLDLSSNDNLYKNKVKNNKTKLFKKLPYLNFINLEQLNKSDRKKNTILYNNIIRQFNNSITLTNNEINDSYKTIIERQKHNINSLFRNKENIFGLSKSNQNTKSLNKSCIFKNELKLGDINDIKRSKSKLIEMCFACDLGCSVSKSGYSPMTYCPYTKEKRDDTRALIYYEKYVKPNRNNKK